MENENSCYYEDAVENDEQIIKLEAEILEAKIFLRSLSQDDEDLL